jgi:putative ABC transport system substrate-binding protein
MSPLSVATAARNIAALRNRLRELGYTEGRNINIEYRFGDGLAERFPVLVADLLALKPAVIVVGSTAGILAARKVTKVTPLIWFGSVDDPVTFRLDGEFRVGWHVAGFLLSNDAVWSARLELLRDVHGFSRVGVVLTPSTPGTASLNVADRVGNSGP